MIDYHDFTNIDTPKNERARLHVGDIYINETTCLLCNDTIRSKNKHDYTTCKCGNVSADGGSYYAKRSFKTPDSFRDNIVYFTDAPQMKKFFSHNDFKI